MSFAIVDSEDTQKYTIEEIIKIEDIAYNLALEDFFNKCLEENIQFYLNPIDCMNEVKKQLKK